MNASEALAVLSSRKIDLILLDLVMANCDGFEMLENRSNEHRGVPVIVLSGLNTAWTAAAAMRLGAVDYVPKPFDEDALLALIRTTLGSPAGQRGRTPGMTARRPLVLLVGVHLGIHASLTVLLRQRCQVERGETIVDTLAYPTAVSPAFVIVDLGRSGSSQPTRSAESALRRRKRMSS